MQRRMFTIREVSESLGKSTIWTRRMIKRGLLQASQFGPRNSAWLITEAALKKFIKSARVIA
jgi:predicted DNA-binding transcriptional regulator AlpA